MCGVKAKEGPFVPWLDRSCSLPAEPEKGLMRFGDLQTMKRVRTGKRLLLEKQRRGAAAAAAAGADKSPEVFLPPPAGGQPSSAHAVDKLKKLVTPSRGSSHKGNFFFLLFVAPLVV